METDLQEENSEPVVIPWDRLDAETLHRVLESFVLREGTDYGNREFSLDDKVAMVMRQLQQGKARLVFDPRSESCTVLPVH